MVNFVAVVTFLKKATRLALFFNPQSAIRNLKSAMSLPRILILRAPGTNCDAETAFAFERAGGLPEVLHLNRLLEAPQLVADYQVLCIPGGFSYGDDVAAGRIFANQIRHHLGDVLAEFRASTSPKWCLVLVWDKPSTSRGW